MPFPPELSYLWRIHSRLRRRQGNGMGLNPVGWPELDAFLRHSKLHLAPWEIEVIEDLDDLYLRVNGSRYRKKDAE